MSRESKEDFGKVQMNMIFTKSQSDHDSHQVVMKMILISNFRPISVLSIISKKIENLYTINCILGNVQWGFRPHQSTQVTFLDVSDNFRKIIDNKKATAIVFLVYAFDSINHDILLKKQTTIELKWFDLYLRRRNQSTECLLTKIIDIDVPRFHLGSWIILYMNDLPASL